MLAVRAGPPFNPPSRPSATAAGFFLDLIAMSAACHEPNCYSTANLFRRFDRQIYFQKILSLGQPMSNPLP